MSGTASTHPPPQRPLMGIGACLAGNAVRYNGETNSPNRFVRDICQQFDTAPFCPEVGIGLGVPRPPIHLVGENDTVRVLDVASHREDYTEALRSFARQVLREAPMLCGYILVTGSPSCGNRKVKRFSRSGDLIASDQTGMFARALQEADPLLPCADDGQLYSTAQRDRFMTRASAYHDWKTLVRQGLSRAGLTSLYERYRGQVRSRDPASDRVLLKMLSGARGGAPEDGDFIGTLMASLAREDLR